MSSQSTDSSKLLGVVLLIRHGDRSGLYQDPTTYTASHTQITPLGTVSLPHMQLLDAVDLLYASIQVQENQLGAQLRSLYINTSSPSYIPGMNTTLLDESQVQIFADAGDEGGVIFDSSVALTQGLWPPTTINAQTLANGTFVTAAMGGYQVCPSLHLGEPC